MIKAPPNMRSLIAVLRTPELAEEIEVYCAASHGITAKVKIADAAVKDAPAIINGGADIVIIEVGAADKADLAALEQLCAHVARGGSFIVIMEDPSADIVRRLFRAGVTDVLSTPVTPVELVAALDTTAGRRTDAPTKASSAAGKIVTVVKTAGGVGATTVAVNTAGALAGMIQGKVALVDLDIQFGQIAMALDVMPKMTVLDAVRAASRLDPTLLASTMHEHESGVNILSAPNEITPLDAISETFIAHLFANLRAMAEVSIVEIPAAWTQWIGVALDKSDLVAPVAEASVRSAAGAARISQSFIDFGLTRLSLHVLINKFDKTIENNERARKIGEVFRSKPAGVIRLDAKAAQEAADRGILFSATSQKALAAKDFETNGRSLAAALSLSISSKTDAQPPLARILGGKLASRGRVQ